MAWVRAEFRDQKVWAEVNEAGVALIVGGRRSVRYSDKAGATIYRAGADLVQGLGGAPVVLPEGMVAAEPARQPTRQASANAGSAASGGGGASPPATPPRPSGRASGFGSAGTRSAGQAAAANADATRRVSAAAAIIRCFTDGGCLGNPGPCGSGLVVKFPDGRTVERHRALGIGTNNIGELTAIGMALEVLAETHSDPAAEVVVFSDSQYARGVLTLGWKAKANVELIAGIRARLRERPGVRLEWVAGHVGLPENERADRLAAQGVEESRRR